MSIPIELREELTEEFMRKFAPMFGAEEIYQDVWKCDKPLYEISSWFLDKFETYAREREDRIIRALREEYGDFMNEGIRVGKVLHTLGLLPRFKTARPATDRHDWEVTEEYKDGKFVGDRYTCKKCGKNDHLCPQNKAVGPNCSHMTSFNYGCPNTTSHE